MSIYRWMNVVYDTILANLRKKKIQAGMMVCTFNPPMGEAEAGGSQFKDSLDNLTKPHLKI